tara:strand:+ start:693 stop:1829 length:1137 start_codon:yes stop_codon:yes gene_type:complete
MNKKNKKILFIVNVDWFFISHRLPIAQEAIKNGYEVHLATVITSFKKKIESEGIHLHCLELKRSTINPLINCISLFQMFSLIRRIRPSILHLVTIKPILIGGLAALLSRIIYNVNAGLVFSITGVGYPFTSKSRAAILIKLIISILYKFSFMHKEKFVIFQNKDDQNLISSIARIKNSECILIPGSGVDLSEYTYKPIPTGTPVIMFAARLLKSKGILEFVEAAKSFKSSRFVLVGMLDTNNRDCIDKKQLEEWLCNKTIEYWGYSKSMSKTLNKSTIVVLPSYKEGFPKVLIEASACGRPIITTNVTGCRDAVEPNETGLLIPIKDSISLVKEIKYLLSNPEVIKEMGKRGRALAEKKYDINIVIKRHMEIYNILTR